MKRALKFIVIFLITIALIFHFLLPRFIIEINNPILSTARKIVGKTQYENRQESKLLRYDYIGYEGIKCVAYINTVPDSIRKGTVILVHGISANHFQFEPVSDLLTKHHYQTISLDLRAHGLSEGKFCTFGAKEKMDISLLIDDLKRKNLISNNLGIWGLSLGAAVSLQSLAFDERFKFGIIESTFTDFPKIVTDYMQDYTGIHNEALGNYMANRASTIANFNINDASPGKICSQIIQPILMVHGDADTKIIDDYGKANFELLSSENKTFETIHGAGHVNLWEVGGEAYFELVLGFIASQSLPNQAF